MELLTSYGEKLQAHIEATIPNKEPRHLYEPIHYILKLGGKRLRPVLTLMTCDFFETDCEEAMSAALAVELFHNFSLIHDDIMDDAPLRRGNTTVHEKWDLNTGILSGDAMLILAYQLFEAYPAERFRELAQLFSKTAIEVCEGQQYDVDFETRDDVTLEEYITMIDYKTAVLLGAAMKMGAIVAGASETCKDSLYQFGRNLGIAFQLQDDYLDAFGDPNSFGKLVGGDIIANKKTFLYITAMNNASRLQAKELEGLSSITPKDPQEKIEAVKRIFISTGADEALQREIEFYTEKANTVLSAVKMSEDKKTKLREFSHWLMRRTV
ncbi:polyprenyl synthetase family protein [Altibacter sp. HG106]|uniref:polyprenyl synthetase family protein n=1 Tax=Altibacter sp. HG106 TaxID=3023937 RepID=UPI00234FCD3F|nr:polyprenyl synthetase family protein [Altibacter sp. HG106]MDC7994754.1 polyprenyl synthetase family protein [Altibacter sp. HG106]